MSLRNLGHPHPFNKTPFGITRTALKERGFTILELLIVVAVIGILSAGILALTGDTKTKSRDNRRAEDMRQIQNALNIYFTDNNRFPVEPDPVTVTGSDDFSNALVSEGTIDTVPTDPLHPKKTYTYESSASGADYTLRFCLETDNIKGYSKGCDNTLSP